MDLCGDIIRVDTGGIEQNDVDVEYIAKIGKNRVSGGEVEGGGGEVVEEDGKEDFNQIRWESRG